MPLSMIQSIADQWSKIKVDVAGIALGGSMAIAPAKVPERIPFYESELWMGVMAISGLTILLLTGVKLIHDIIRIRKDPEWTGEERRNR